MPLVVGIGEFAFHAQALGASGAIVSAVGDDRSGRETPSRRPWSQGC